MSAVSIVLLCEDSQTESFVRRFLKRRNFKSRDIRTLPLADGERSGEQWVRERYPAQLRAIRGRQRAYLIVVTDADAGTTEALRRRLDEECGQEDVQVKTVDDPVIIAVPRRNIETWLAYLQGTQVDEVTVYPKLKRERDCEEHAGSLYRMCHEEQKLTEPAPPSLVESCGEYGRLAR